MPRYDINEPLKNNHGVTLVEVMIVLVLTAMVTTAVVGLFGVGIKSFTYSVRQTSAFANARRAMDTGDPSPGMIWQARQAASAGGLSSSQLILNSSTGQAMQYDLNGTSLRLTQTGQTLALGSNITALQFAYYNMDSSGLIMISTAAASSSLVTTRMQSQQGGKTAYTFFSGSRLRNHP